MRKKIISTPQQHLQTPDDKWLDLEHLAEVQITSEHPDHPIESALLQSGGSGWRAAQAGEQTIRLVFNSPQQVRRIWLEFVEPHHERTQQFVLRWSADDGNSFQEIARQQWNFSPQGAKSETEDFRVDLPAASVIELTIIPDISGGEARATLARFRLG